MAPSARHSVISGLVGMANLLLGKRRGSPWFRGAGRAKGDALDGNGREGRTKPRGLGRPTKRSITFVVAVVLFVLAAIAVLLLGLL